jgi:hypothetical protein
LINNFKYDATEDIIDTLRIPVFIEMLWLIKIHCRQLIRERICREHGKHTRGCEIVLLIYRIHGIWIRETGIHGIGIREIGIREIGIREIGICGIRSFYFADAGRRATAYQ